MEQKLIEKRVVFQFYPECPGIYWNGKVHHPVHKILPWSKSVHAVTNPTCSRNFPGSMTAWTPPVLVEVCLSFLIPSNGTPRQYLKVWHNHFLPLPP
jgi:hypothetical protein